MSGSSRPSILGLGERMLELAKRSGADQAEVYVEVSSTTAIYVKDQSTENLTATDVSGAALRVLCGSSLGFGSTNRFEDDNLRDLVNNTIASARCSTPDEFNCFAEPQAPADRDLELFDEQVGAAPIESKIERAFLLEGAARALDPRIKRSAYIVYEDGTIHWCIVNSLGVASESRSSFCAGVSWVGAVDGIQVETGLIEGASTRYSGLDCKKIGEEAARKAIALLGARKAQSGRMPVVMDGRAAGQFLMFLAMLISADNVQKGKSILADRLGETIASPKVTIMDDGLMVGGLASSRVDDVGYPRQKTAVIEAGKLRSFIYDSYTAKKGGTKSTGNANRRGYRVSPIVNTTNFYVEPGQPNEDELLSEMGSGILVTSIRDLFAGIDISTGDFSIPGQGIKIEGGERAYPVKDFQISGNLLTMLSDVVQLGGILKWSNGSRFGSPDLLIKELSVAGG